jgi:hypothetical protein
VTIKSPSMVIEEFVPIVEALEPLAPDERARVILYCILKYAPDAFSHTELFMLMDQARAPKQNGAAVP